MKKTKRCVFSLCEGGLEAAGWWYEVERQSHDWSMIVERMLTKRPVGVCGAFISFSDFTARFGIEYILFYPGTVEGLGVSPLPKIQDVTLLVVSRVVSRRTRQRSTHFLCGIHMHSQKGALRNGHAAHFCQAYATPCAQVHAVYSAIHSKWPLE